MDEITSPQEPQAVIVTWEKPTVKEQIGSAAVGVGLTIVGSAVIWAVLSVPDAVRNIRDKRRAKKAELVKEEETKEDTPDTEE